MRMPMDDVAEEHELQVTQSLEKYCLFSFAPSLIWFLIKAGILSFVFFKEVHSLA